MAGYWSIITPVATTNLFHDPSFELADPDTEWDIVSDGVGSDYTRSTTYVRYGLSSTVPTFAGGATYATIFQTITVTATSYTLSARIAYTAGPLTSALTQARFDSANSNWDSITDIGGNYWLCVKTATATAGAREFGVRMLTASCRVDACQLENLAYRTTYCDGTQEDCWWLGAPHTSASSRSAQSLAGGRVVNLDDFTAYVTNSPGIGMAPVRHHAQPYALLPGAMYQGTKIQSRSLSLVIEVMGSSRANLHALRKVLVNALKIDQVATPQPFILRYTGMLPATASATIWPLDIRVLYEGGLEFNVSPTADGFNERIALRLLALDPFWTMADGEKAALLDVEDTLTSRYLMARVSGTWNAACLPAAGAAAAARVACWGPDNRLYIGGDFTDWDGDVDCDYIARYDPITDDWEPLGQGASDDVDSLCFGSDGNLYVGGAFTTVIQHDAAALTVRTVARWNLTTEHWEALGPPAAPGTAVYGSVYALCFDDDGYLWAGGDFDNFDNIANADSIVRWSGAAWSAPAAGVSVGGEILALARGLDGRIWAAGMFTTLGGVACENIAYWTGAAYVEPAPGLNGTTRALAVAANGDIYAGGSFTATTGATVDMQYIGWWDGVTWHALGSPAYNGVDAAVRALRFGPDNMLWLAGDFTAFQFGTGRMRGVGRWNGSAFMPADMDIGGIASTSLAVGYRDPVVIENYDVYATHDSNTAQGYSGTATVTNNGTATTYPRFVVNRSGGTSARMRSLRNETTGKEILLDLLMLDNETITIDLRETIKTATSSTRGNILGEVNRGSDFATWGLQPGVNVVTCYVETGGAPTMTAYLLWNDRHWSAGG